MDSLTGGTIAGGSGLAAASVSASLAAFGIYEVNAVVLTRIEPATQCFRLARRAFFERDYWFVGCLGAVIGNRFNGRENLLLVLREDLDNVAVLAVCDLEHIGPRWQHSTRHLNGIVKGHKGLFVPLVCTRYRHEN